MATTKKTLNLRAVKEYIRRQHATWEMIEDRFQYSRVTIQRKLKESYKLESAYKKLLDEVRENTRLKKEADALVSTPSPVVSTPTDIIVVETGYLMKVGLDDLLNTNQDIVIPEFCVGELKKLSQSSTSATKALALVRQKSDAKGPITLLKLEENVLVEEPLFPVKRRSIGVVAVCCDVYAVTPSDRKICLLTTSYEVEQLANAQGFGPNVIVKRYRDTNS